LKHTEVRELFAALQAATILVAMASEKKYLATKILTKVANWLPTDYKRNLLGKLINVWSNYQR